MNVAFAAHGAPNAMKVAATFSLCLCALPTFCSVQFAVRVLAARRLPGVNVDHSRGSVGTL